MNARAPLASVRLRGAGASLPGGVRRGRVDGPHVVVLVAVVVLDVEDVLAVAGPEEPGNRPLRLGREQAGLLEGLAGLLHVDVAGVLPRLQEGDVLAVGGELRRGDLGVAEEQLAVEQRGLARSRRGRLGRGLGGRAGRQSAPPRRAQGQGGQGGDDEPVEPSHSLRRLLVKVREPAVAVRAPGRPCATPDGVWHMIAKTIYGIGCAGGSVPCRRGPMRQLRPEGLTSLRRIDWTSYAVDC